MDNRFVRYFKIVAAVHVGILLVLFVSSMWNKFFHRKARIEIPVEFVVQVSHASDEESVRKPIPKDNPKDVSEPAIKIKKTPIKRSTERVKQPKRGSSSSQLTAEQIKKLLAQGAKPADHTSVPDENTRQLEVVRRALYDAWVQPSAEEAGDAVAEIVIQLQGDGTITKRALKKKSGNEAIDASVMQAVNSVNRINGLSSDFIRRYSQITISFKVE
ncbi:TonB C-terminal domain-containing protein [Verrucomicrobiota bacterium]